jgi:chemotaxis response regulator CheB
MPVRGEPKSVGIAPDCPAHDTRCRPGQCVFAKGEASTAQGFIQITANDIETEPGIGMGPVEMQLRKDLARIRRERNAAIERADLAELNLERSSVPPTRKQKAVGVGVLLGKYAGLLVVLPALGAALAKLWPEYADLIALVVGLVGQ